MSEIPAVSPSTHRTASLTLPVVGVICAIAITTTMDAAGLSNFSALVLCPLLFLFWALNRLPRIQVGFTMGQWKQYGLAVFFPILIMGIISVIAVLAGAVHITKTNWAKAGANLALEIIVTFLIAIVTEEGFFRGWLWGSLRATGMKTTRVIIWTSLAFAMWHISAVTLSSEFKTPPLQIPILLMNAAVIGAIWGLLRAWSGSIIVTSLSHGVWNGLAYVFFGFGTTTGAFGITSTSIFGPENGVLGVGLNLIFLLLLWRWWVARDPAVAA